MPYTPSSTLTVPATGGYTPSTTLVVDGGAFETYTLTGAISLTVYDTYTLSGSVDITKYSTYSLGGDIQVNVEDKFHLTGVIELNVISSSETYSLSGNIAINVELPFINYALSGAIALSKYAEYALSSAIHINKIVPVTTLSLGVILRIQKYEVFNLSRGIEIVKMPFSSGGLTGQGTGDVIPLPSGNTVKWALRVILDGVDFSSRVTGTVSIDKERNAAVVAVFSIRPSEGLVDVYAWKKKVVSISYLELNSAGAPITFVKLFTGIVDTPIMDASSGHVEFTCTDALQTAVIGAAHEHIDELTPLSKWSKFIYDEEVDGWQYLQQRLETYPYLVGLDANQTLYSMPWVSRAPEWEFNETTIIDSSLSVAVANAVDLVNSVDVTMAAQYDVYRESVFNLQWHDEKWYHGADLIWLLCDMQMICDSVSSAGATFIGNPQFNAIPSSRTLLIEGSPVEFINDGSELLALEFRASVSKRFTQNTLNSMKVQVYSPESVSASGPLRSTVEGNIQVQYAQGMTEKFMATEQVTKWALTAGIGLSEGFDSSTNFITEPQIFQGDGWVYYPKRPYSFTRYKQDGPTSISFSSLNHLPEESEGTYDFSFSAFGHPKTAGEHFYDMDDYATVGSVGDRQALLDTLKAQARTAIVESHRQNTVAFKSFIQPRVERGAMVRVATSSVVASGLVNQIVHEFDIDSGRAESAIIISVSSVKSIGLPEDAVEVYRLSGVISINKRNTQGSGVGIRLAGPYTTTGMIYHNALTCHYHSGVVDNLWEGHITPADRTLNSGPNQFVILFPDLLEANTENATLETALDAWVVDVDQDELFLISK